MFGTILNPEAKKEYGQCVIYLGEEVVPNTNMVIFFKHTRLHIPKLTRNNKSD